MVDFSVAIRTYNKAHQIPPILEALRSQIGTESIDWEIVIVDNNSNDGTADLVQKYQSEWDRPFPIRYFFEPRQGASIARKLAIKESRGKFIGFLDDDNIPASDWVAEAYSFGEAHPEAGAFSGQIHGKFEVEPPPNFRQIASYLAIIERGDKVFSYNTRKGRVLPPGAGLIICKQVWLDCVPDNLLLLGPVGKSLGLKGEDMESLAHVQNASWEILYNPKLHIYHEVPAWRLERDYLLSLVRSIGLAQHHIRMTRARPWQKPFILPVYLLNDIRKTFIYFIKNHKSISTDVVAACEMERLTSGVISPFYLWKNATKKLS
ncbi:MAG: glycosyltransferase family 2 protein [Leptolyngbyaceae cyanobacterium SL_5_14]|nr:glycosyltransferase family 2 protein [Leptolyngbyaceae cyanobacterium SL_5_14]